MILKDMFLSTTLAMLALATVGSSSTAQASGDTNDRNVREYNLGPGQIGLKGYDPVSYFNEGGAEPQAGRTDLVLDYKGVSYRFATAENQDKFLRNPKKFEPTYGGWCAYAMAFNQKVDVDPELYYVEKNRLHLFISEDARAQFLKNVASFERRADTAWKRLSGENARK